MTTIATIARVISVRGVPTSAKFGTRREAAVYEARVRADGVTTWRCVEQYSAGGWTERSAERAGRELAERLGLPFVAGLRHGAVLS